MRLSRFAAEVASSLHQPPARRDSPTAQRCLFAGDTAADSEAIHLREACPTSAPKEKVKLNEIISTAVRSGRGRHLLAASTFSEFGEKCQTAVRIGRERTTPASQFPASTAIGRWKSTPELCRDCVTFPTQPDFSSPTFLDRRDCDFPTLKRDLPSGFSSLRTRSMEGNSLIIRGVDFAVGHRLFELSDALRGGSRRCDYNFSQAWAFREMLRPLVGDACVQQPDFP